MNIDQRVVDAVLDDWTTAPVDGRVRAGLKLIETLTRHPADLDAEFIAELERAGLDVEAIEDAANVAFHFNFINRLADAFDFPLLDDGQRRKLAKTLNRAARLTAGPRPEPAWIRGADGCVRPIEVEIGRTRALEAPGVTEASLRRAVEAHAASWFGGHRPSRNDDALPDRLRAYVEKVARWAYKVIDEDIDGLRDAGWDDEAIFELTFAAALGASVPALERLFLLLHAPASTRDPASRTAPALAS